MRHLKLVYRLSSVLLCIGLIAGNLAVCAGWTASPEARMACCADDGTCPMHDDDSRDSTAGRLVTQAEADSCCASSDREPSGPSTSNVIATVSLAILGPGIAVPASVPALVRSDHWRTVSPLPVAPVPRHLLLSVFLV